MSSRRIVQSVLLQSLRSSAQRSFAPTVRANLVLNKGAFSVTLGARRYNTQVSPSSDIFKVVDFDDIQTIVKNDGKGYDLIDVREEKEVAQGVIPTANNVPLSKFANAWTLSDQEFQDQFGFEKPKKESQVILYCLGGVRSTKAAEYLYSLGYKNLENYVGSWADYVEKVKKEGEK